MKNTKKKKGNGFKGLSMLMALSIGAAVFFGYQSYSVDHSLSLPVVGTVIGSKSTSFEAPASSGSSTSETSSSKTASSKTSGSSSSAGMLMQMAQ